MVQSGNGRTQRKFGLLIGNSEIGRFIHISRDGDLKKWSKISVIGGVKARLVGHPVIIGTSLNRDFHAVGVSEDVKFHQSKKR